jgi:predicted pyridoxine 5'-phosphate oxidase superfamily flavin-nucleotide-binding protein
LAIQQTESGMSTPSSDIAFTPTVKAIQARRGSREAYERLEQRGGFRKGITPELAAFIAGLDSVYVGTASADGQPYIQHRGGPKGFLKVLDEQTLGLADYRGNRQYITTGNLADNPRAFLFLMDYARRRRIKIWGRARTVEDDPALLARVADPDGPAAEQAILFEVEAWDINCPQHIPQKIDAEDVVAVVARLQGRIEELERIVSATRSDPAGEAMRAGPPRPG